MEAINTLESLPLAGLAIVAGIIIGITLLARWLIFRFIPPLMERHSPLWADILAKRHVLRYLYLIVPGLLVAAAIGIAPGVDTPPKDIVYSVSFLYSVMMIATALSASLLAYNDFYNAKYDFAKQVPIKTIIQTSIVFIYLSAFLVIIAVLLNVPIIALVGIVAILAGIATFLFSEPLHGFSASLQLSMNHMLSIGDWMEMPMYGADGLVEDINITSTKVHNWDNSTVNIPTYTLIQNAFQNWTSMQDMGARRIKRPIYIDQRSIEFASDELISASLEKITQLYANIPADIRSNKGFMGVSPQELHAREELTNLELFMAYATEIIAGHPLTCSDSSIYVRQQDPSPQGLPVETFFFTQATDFIPYHAVQREIFSHLLAKLDTFGLRPFQLLDEIE